jgi:uncharacterized protein
MSRNITKSAFAIYSKLGNGKIRYFQFFEDTYNTAASFRRSGSWNIENASGVKTVGK